jgi:hypothetical protein
MIDQPVCPPDSILSICRNRLCGVWSTKLYVPHMELYLCYNYVLPTCMSHIWNCLCAIWSAILYAHQSESSRWCMIDQAVCPTTGTFWVLYDRPSYMPVSRSSRWCIVGQQEEFEDTKGVIICSIILYQERSICMICMLVDHIAPGQFHLWDKIVGRLYTTETTYWRAYKMVDHIVPRMFQL